MVEKKKIGKWVVAVAVLLLILLLPDGVTSRLKGALRSLITPVQSVVLRAGRSLKEGADTVRGFGGLAEQNLRLKGEVVRLQARARLNKNIRDDNLKLRRMLNFHQRQTYALIPAEAAARSISGWWQSIRLAKGTNDGIVKNRAVISPDGLVGRTSDVSAHTADVLLLSDPACQVSARVSRTGSFGLVSGQGMNRKGYPVARMKFIHRETPIRVGDEVVTSGLGGVYPRNILIGYIDSIQMGEGELYQVAEIIPQAVVNLTDVVFVSADKPEDEE